MNNDIELSREDWDIVEYQCRYCRLWSNTMGCFYEGVDPHPVKDCNLLEENRYDTEHSQS